MERTGLPGASTSIRLSPAARLCTPTCFPVHHPDVSKHLMFRGYLKAHPGAAHEYAQLKRELASKYRDDRRAYTDARAEFISGITKIATEWTRSLA